MEKKISSQYLVSTVRNTEALLHKYSRTISRELWEGGSIKTTLSSDEANSNLIYFTKKYNVHALILRLDYSVMAAPMSTYSPC